MLHTLQYSDHRLQQLSFTLSNKLINKAANATTYIGSLTMENCFVACEIFLRTSRTGIA